MHGLASQRSRASIEEQDTLPPRHQHPHHHYATFLASSQEYYPNVKPSTSPPATSHLPPNLPIPSPSAHDQQNNTNNDNNNQNQQLSSPKAPTTALSPLELLEQRSRRLANRFGKKPNDVNDIKTSNKPINDNLASHQQHPSTNSQSAPENFESSSDSPANTASDNVPTSRRGRIARKASTASITSIASLGSILGSFRLSSLSIDDTVDLTPTTSAASFYPNQQSQPQSNTAFSLRQQPSLQPPALVTSHVTLPSTQATASAPSQSLPALARRGAPSSLPHPYPTSPGLAPLSSNSSISTTVSASGLLHSPSVLPVSPPVEPDHYPVLISSGSHGSLTSINENNYNNSNNNNNGNNNISSSASSSSLNASPRLMAMTSPRAKPPAFPPATTIPSSSQGLHPRTANQRSFSGSSLSSIASGKQQQTSHSRTPSSIHHHAHSHPLSEFELLKEKRINNTLTLEDHVALGIYYHEEGNLRESSYHWQHAAFQGDITAMLLYGLALRHGWGIRKNPESAVEWLQRAIRPILHEYKLEDVLQNQNSTERFKAFLSSSNDDKKEKGKTGGKLKKTHVSLAFYELGMCYLNAWGIEKDEDLALRCFELAGSLGDPDALSEAARMWTHNGPKGRKKDYMRAARLYRLAEKNGANVVANSWIYKDKYMDPDEDDDGSKKPDKDRRRSGILKKMKK